MLIYYCNGPGKLNFLFIKADVKMFDFSICSLTTRNNMKPPRTNGSGQQTDLILSTLPKTLCNRATWVVAFTLYVPSTARNNISQHFLPLLHPQVEYKYDKEMLKGCVIPVVDDKLTVLCKKNAELASEVNISI